MKTAIIATAILSILALPVTSTASAAAPSLGTITVKGGGALQPGATATVDVMCQQDGTATNGAHLFAPVAALWLGGAGGQMVWQFSSRQPGACVWITGTGITPFEMPTVATISVPSWATPGPTTLVATDPQGRVIARAAVTIAGTVTKPATGNNPYLTVPTGKGAKTSGTTTPTPKTSTSTPKTSTSSTSSLQSVVRIVAPRGHRTPWWTRLLKRVLGMF